MKHCWTLRPTRWEFYGPLSGSSWWWWRSHSQKWPLAGTALWFQHQEVQTSTVVTVFFQYHTPSFPHVANSTTLTTFLLTNLFSPDFFSNPLLFPHQVIWLTYLLAILISPIIRCDHLYYIQHLSPSSVYCSWSPSLPSRLINESLFFSNNSKTLEHAVYSQPSACLCISHQNNVWTSAVWIQGRPLSWDCPPCHHRETLHCLNSLPLLRCHSAGPFSGIRHCELCTSFLTDQTYRATWKGSGSDPCSLLTGVPQGSVLGPIVFSLYTKSLGHSLALLFVYHSYVDET